MLQLSAVDPLFFKASSSSRHLDTRHTSEVVSVLFFSKFWVILITLDYQNLHGPAILSIRGFLLWPTADPDGLIFSFRLGCVYIVYIFFFFFFQHLSFLLWSLRQMIFSTNVHSNIYIYIFFLSFYVNTLLLRDEGLHCLFLKQVDLVTLLLNIW